MTGPDLVASILAGDARAEEELVRRYRPGVFVVVRQVVGDPSLAEDLTQEALALVLRKMRAGEVREPDRLSGFVCSVARNLALASRRRSNREETGSDIQAVDPRAGPLDRLLSREREAAVRKVLSELNPARDREILYRFYIAEEDKESICAGLGLSSLHFNRVLYRARERFRELFEKKRGGGSSGFSGLA